MLELYVHLGIPARLHIPILFQYISKTKRQTIDFTLFFIDQPKVATY